MYLPTAWASALPAAALLLICAGPASAQIPRAPRDTVSIEALFPRADSAALADPAAFDAPGTAVLVARVSREGSQIPPGLDDYRAELRSAVSLALRTDPARGEAGGEVPVTVDEFAGEVRWDRGGEVLQTVHGHRVRQLAPTPYTVGALLEAPWIVPHLYGNTINVFRLATTRERAGVSRAVHPFSPRGVELYRYAAGDTVRVRTQEGTTTLVPVEVRPRPGAEAEGDLHLVAGTFYVDLDRASIARARFGFTERSRGLLVPAETGVFFELESGLVGGRYWLPVRQRREIQVTSPVFGGAIALRMLSALSGFDLNTGWEPEARGSRLVWDLRPRSDAFAGWDRAVGEETAELAITDFADLRQAVRAPTGEGGPLKVALAYEQPGDLIRFNRVEGPFLGLGVRIAPREPAERDWSAYAAAGWAFAEETARGELSLRWHPNPNALHLGPRWTAEASAYRELRDMVSFRPPLEWGVGQTLNAALGGYDVRDYYDAAGVEAAAARRRGPWTARFGARWEEQDSVTRNTDSFLFGEAEEFPEVVAARPGTHAALEGSVRYARGTGAFGITRGTVAGVSAMAGFGDFDVARLIATLSTRRPGKYLTVIGRADAGIVTGDAPPQFLFRFGGAEGLRGFERNEFGGSRAALARGRALLHLPPYGSEPLYRSGFFLIPPLRPALVLSADAGWAEATDRTRDALGRLLAEETGGVRTSYGVGVSFFEDAIAAEYVWPGNADREREGKWYLGFTTWF